jgi:hypothetical protein
VDRLPVEAFFCPNCGATFRLLGTAPGIRQSSFTLASRQTLPLESQLAQKEKSPIGFCPMKDAAQATKRVKEIRRDLQALTEDYKTEKINIELEHAKALKRLENDYKQRSKFLQHEIENMGESLAS